MPDPSPSLLHTFRTEKHTSTIPIIVVSGDASLATSKRLASLGATTHLAKPFDAQYLRSAIAVHLVPSQL